MTVFEIIGMLLRRWYVTMICLTFAIGSSYMLDTQQRSFVTQTEFAMVPPKTTTEYAPPEDTQATLIDFADLVARRMNAEYPTYQLSAPWATLFGNGIRNGSSVKLENTGSQWSPRYGSPVISVQIIDSSVEGVRQRLDSIATQIDQTTKELQTAGGAGAHSLITAETDSTKVVIGSFGPTRAGSIKGKAVLVLVSLCLAAIIAAWVDRWSAKRTITNTIDELSHPKKAATQPHEVRRP